MKTRSLIISYSLGNDTTIMQNFARVYVVWWKLKRFYNPVLELGPWSLVTSILTSFDEYQQISWLQQLLLPSIGAILTVFLILPNLADIFSKILQSLLPYLIKAGCIFGSWIHIIATVTFVQLHILVSEERSSRILWVFVQGCIIGLQKGVAQHQYPVIKTTV